MKKSQTKSDQQEILSNIINKEICEDVKKLLIYNLKKSHKRLDELISDLNDLTSEQQIREIVTCELQSVLKFISFSTQHILVGKNKEQEISDLIPKYWKDALQFPSNCLDLKDQWRLSLEQEFRKIQKEEKESNVTSVKDITTSRHTIEKSMQVSNFDWDSISDLNACNQYPTGRIDKITYSPDPDFSSDPVLTFEWILKTCLANTDQKYTCLPDYATDAYSKHTYEELKAMISDKAIEEFNSKGYRAISTSQVTQNFKDEHLNSLKSSRFYGPFFASNYYSIATIDSSGVFRGLWLIVYKHQKINIRENLTTTTIGLNQMFNN